MDVSVIKPSNDLGQVVKKFWIASAKDLFEKSGTCSIIPDGSPGIIIQYDSSHSAVFDTHGLPLPTSFIYGQSTTPCINHIKGNPLIVGINFQPTAFKTLFDIDASELTNSIVDINDIFSQKFVDLLHNTSNLQNIVELFSTQIAQQLLKQKRDRMIDQSITWIMKDTTNVNSKMLSSYFKLSRRQFQRRFKEYVGVSPQTYIRIIKFQKSIHLLLNKEFNKLSDIAYTLNFADQSYFNKEFKIFSGYTPQAFLQTNTSRSFSLQNRKYPFEPLRIVTC